MIEILVDQFSIVVTFEHSQVGRINARIHLIFLQSDCEHVFRLVIIRVTIRLVNILRHRMMRGRIIDFQAVQFVVAIEIVHFEEQIILLIFGHLFNRFGFGYVLRIEIFFDVPE